MQTAQLTHASQMKNFLVGGKGLFTVVSKATGERKTFKVNRPKPKHDGDTPPLFVSFFYGSDNSCWTHFKYVGILDEASGNLVTTKASKYPKDGVVCKAFAFIAKAIFNEVQSALDQFEFYHEGKCCCCGRALTVPQSIIEGIGPKCKEKIGGAP